MAAAGFHLLRPVQHLQWVSAHTVPVQRCLPAATALGGEPRTPPDTAAVRLGVSGL